MNKPKLIISSSYATIITIIFVVIITIWAELASPLKDWLKNFSGHHWVSKSILSILLYGVVAKIYYVLGQNSLEDKIRSALVSLLVVLALGVIAITAFYTFHHFGFL